MNIFHSTIYLWEDMTACLMGCQYMPSVEYFAHWMHHGRITIEAHEHYQKRSWRNRTAIVSPGAPLWLTIPLKKGKHEGMPLVSVEIAYHEPWVRTHLYSFQAAYGKAAFGEEILPGLETIYASKPKLLWDFNLLLLAYCTSLLGGKWEYHLTQTFVPIEVNDKLDLRKGVPAGTSSVEIELLPSYPQLQRLGKPFLANLSILDVLCHLGPDSNNYLAQYAARLYP